MFHKIPQAIAERMMFLEELDRRDRLDGTSRKVRLRQIPPDTGKFIALLASEAPDGALVEIGTSAGYSTLWLALACLETDRKIVTIEIDDDKFRMATETFRLTGLGGTVEQVHRDAREVLDGFADIAFCFLDAEKEIYDSCYELVVPMMVPGGILVADNVISHREILQPFLDRVEADERVDSVVVPIGKGELLCRKR